MEGRGREGRYNEGVEGRGRKCREGISMERRGRKGGYKEGVEGREGSAGKV